MKKLFVLLVFGIFAMGFASAGFAQSQEEGATGEEIMGEDVGILPDSPLYGLKKFGEGIQTFFTFDQVEKAKLKYRLAQLRLSEAEAMAKLGRAAIAENILKEYENSLNELEADQNSLSAAGKDVSSIAGLVGNGTYKHILVLQKVYNKVPDSAKTAIKKVLERSMERHEKISEKIAKLKEGGLVNITITMGNETVTREVPSGFAENFLERAKDMREKIKEEVDMENAEELKEKLAEKIEIGIEKVKDQITLVKEKIAEIEGKNVTEVNKPTLDRILAEAKTHLSNAETALEQKKYREAYHHAIAAEKVLYVAREIYKNKQNIEKVIAEKMEVGREKANMQIESARKQISETESNMAAKNVTAEAAGKVIANAKEHLSKAEQAFNASKYGEAFGQAVAAEKLAINVVRAETAKQKAEALKVKIKEKVDETKEKVKNRVDEKKENLKEKVTEKTEAIKEKVSGSATEVKNTPVASNTNALE